MKTRILILTLTILFMGVGSTALSQAEGGGGGRSTASTVDSTFKRKWRPPVKHTAPRRLVAKRTAADNEAEGDRFYDQKEYDNAMSAYQAAVKLKPTYHAFYRIGWLHNEFGEFSEALAPLDQAIALDPSQASAYTEKGYAHRRLNQFD